MFGEILFALRRGVAERQGVGKAGAGTQRGGEGELECREE